MTPLTARCVVVKVIAKERKRDYISFVKEDEDDEQI